MSLEDKIRATAKAAEGRLESAAGALSGDKGLQAEGEAKRVQARLIDAAGVVKDTARDAAAALGEALGGDRG